MQRCDDNTKFEKNNILEVNLYEAHSSCKGGNVIWN